MEQFNGKDPLDKAFQKFFGNAKLAPSPAVWENINQRIDTSNQRKGVIWFQIAAAILIFAAGYTFYQWTNFSETTNEVSQTLNKHPELKEVPLSTVDEQEQAQTKIVIGDPQILEYDKFSPSAANPVISSVENSENSIPADLKYNEINIQKSGWKFPSYDYSIELNLAPFWKKKVESISDKYWAHAGFGAGSSGLSDGIGFGFGKSADEAAVASYVPETTLDGSVNIGTTTTDYKGTSFSTGFGVGSRIGRKWLIESGLTFMTTRLQATSNTVEVVNGQYFPVYYTPKFQGDLLRVSGHSFTNSLQYLSIPAKFGFRIIDKRVGWLVSSGISTNILLNQTIESSQYESYKVSPADSPFKPVSLNGLLGTEIYVTIGKVYQLGVLTNYNFSLMDITRQDAPFELKPNQFQLGLNLRYIFK